MVLGAFAAHGLKDYLSGSYLEAFQTGVRYQMFHALGLIFMGAWGQGSAVWKTRAAWFFAE